MKDYVIITDAASDLSLDLMQKYDIEIIGMDILINKEDYLHYPDFRNLTAEDFYAQLSLNAEVKTTQISPERYYQTFKKYAKENQGIIYLSLSTGLSSTLQSANIAKEMILEKYAIDLEIFDTKLATMAQGLLAIAASKNKQQGLTLKENMEQLTNLQKNIKTNFTVDDLMFLYRGGRLNATSAIVGTALKVKPILKISENGQLENFTKCRARKGAIKKLVSLYLEETNQSEETIYLVQANCLADAQLLKEKLKEVTNNPIEIVQMGPIIAAHTGPTLLGVIFQ